MISSLKAGRMQLSWHIFKEQRPGVWILSLCPPVYADIFSQQERELMHKADGYWRESSSGRAKYLFLKSLDSPEIKNVKRFLEEYRRYVLVGKSEFLCEHFGNDLNFCMALDFNFERSGIGDRTLTGHLVYQAKYRSRGMSRKTRLAIHCLADQLALGVKRLPRSGRLIDYCLTHVPVPPDKTYDLPSELCRLVADRLSDTPVLRRKNPVVRARLQCPKPAFKDLSCEEKLRHCKKIMTPENVSLSHTVSGYGVIVIDDLYQSGVTMWSYARLLKSAGAAEVLGLTCQKSIRDTDNL